MCIKSMLIDQFLCLENIQIHVTKILLVCWYVHVDIVREGGGIDAGERDGEWRGRELLSKSCLWSRWLMLRNQ